MLQNSFPYICFDWTCMKIKSAASVFSSIAFSRAKMWDSNLWYYQVWWPLFVVCWNNIIFIVTLIISVIHFCRSCSWQSSKSWTQMITYVKHVNWIVKINVEVQYISIWPLIILCSAQITGWCSFQPTPVDSLLKISLCSTAGYFCVTFCFGEAVNEFKTLCDL